MTDEVEQGVCRAEANFVSCRANRAGPGTKIFSWSSIEQKKLELKCGNAASENMCEWNQHNAP